MNLADLPRRKSGRRGARKGLLAAVPDAGTAPSRFENPHGIATDSTLARLAAQAEAEEARAAALAWQDIDPVASGFPGLGTADDWFGLTVLDCPPAGARRYAAAPVPPVTVPPVVLPPAPVTAAECAGRMARLAYPPPDSDRDRYAAVMRQVSAYTGTRSPFDCPAAWTSARPGPVQPPVTHWTPQRAPRLAIEAGSGAAA